MQSNARSDYPPTPLPFISAYSAKVKLALSFPSPSRTKQAHKDECDINNILARYKRTGVLDFQQKHEPQYGDVTALDFQQAQFTVAAANGMFAAMPAFLRARFDNDPYKFLAFVHDERNRVEAEDLGLLKPKPAPPAPNVAPAAPAAAPAEPPAAPATPPPS